jgi:hypothetical protein
MKKKKFKEIIKRLKNNIDTTGKLYSMGVDISDFNSDLYIIIEDLLEEIYTEEGIGWFDWFVYENDFGRGSFRAYDPDIKPILRNVDELYEELQKHRK